MSSYTPCACRDCMDIAVSSDTGSPDLCPACEEAGCSAANIPDALSYDCQRSDAYGVEESDL